ncbi:NmrA domain-containing protein [Mycena indigotica]|uniref:NmrA domain-containing protein n=1 Tax=Mycena indigotica TaxID=2126181 RepID=A0A8H6S311_9AGAR|nr:NmrA domain-containing protein [Mycena indigotica]KAF7291315.1 NmrA domain-containing protein [Mycena indigotica]
MKNILFIGGTGYVGGVVLSRFLERTDLDARITALVRSPDKVQKFQTLDSRNVKNEFVVVKGSHDDAALVEKLVADADEVVSMADCDNLSAMESILRGMKARFEETGIKPVLIHMSGTGCLGDQAKGAFSSTKVYNDLDIPDIETLPPTQNHRNVDLAIVAADADGYAQTHIVVPGAFFGIPGGILADHGLQNTSNFAWQILFRASFARSAAAIVGAGENMIAIVDINETADLIVLLYDAIQAGQASHGREGYYFVTGDSIKFSRIVEVLEAHTGPRKPLTQEELDTYLPGAVSLQAFFGDNGMAISARGKGMGWRPVLGAEALLKYLADTIAMYHA